MDLRRVPKAEGLFRCGLPTRHLKDWLSQNGEERLRIASYGISSYKYFGHYVPQNVQLELLVGVGGIDPWLVADLSGAPAAERWQRLLERSTVDQRNRVLHVLSRTAGWQRAGAKVRIAPPGRQRGLMHLKLYLGNRTALVGSANFTSKGITGGDQHELLLEVNAQSHIELCRWWSTMWAMAWPIDDSSEESNGGAVKHGAYTSRSYSKENIMSPGPQALLGHWLGKWGAWALNGNGVVAYPHQLQAVEWIRPDEKAYLLGDEVGLGKTYTAALIWMRHQHLYGDKARLIYITKPSLIIDAISAFVEVLGVDELLQTTSHSPPQRANDLRPNFSIFHAGTFCWEMVADEGGRKKNKDHQVAGLLKEGRYRIRPEAFLKHKLEWLSALAARKLHEQINISAVSRLLDSVYTFVSIDTLRNPENPLTHVFDKMEQSSLVPLLIVDESHGLGRTTRRRSAIADLIWGPRDYVGNPPILHSPGALVVHMTGTPVHPNESETASRLGLLDLDPNRTPHKLSYYDDVRTPTARDILAAVRERAVIRRKEGITLDGKPDGLPIFPKRLVFPFQKWIGSAEKGDDNGPPEAITKTSKDVLMAIDQYVASEASHGAKLVSLIRRILRSARDWVEIKKLVKDSEARKQEGDGDPLGEKVVRFADEQIESTSGEDQNRWKSLRIALEAARVYEDKLKDPRLENLTWKSGHDDNGKEEKQMLFTKVGWVATAYDSLAKGTKKTINELTDPATGDVPDEDEETAGELAGTFDSVDEMLKSAHTAKRLADEYLDPTLLNDDSKARFSMLVALLEGRASLRLWPKRYESMADEDRFGWGVEEVNGTRLLASLSTAHSELNLQHPWVVHARYIHSVVDTAVRLQLRYGREGGKPLVGIIIGDTPNYKRDEIKDDFSKGKLDIVCMSDAGAEGINLQRSNRIVLLDVPVSPGRIEQIAGRVHRLGSTHAAQVTLLLPPGVFGTRVFEALRKAASSVFRMAAGSRLPPRPESGADDDPYYVRQLAEYEARLLTAVAETSGVIRGEENRAAVQQVVSQPERDGRPNTAPIEPLFKNGFELIQEQRKRFAEEGTATQSALMPEVSDLVDALVKFDGATVAESLSKFRVPIRITNERERPDEYGDLETREQPFRVLQLKDRKRYWYGPQRFLPTDVPKEEGFEWLGVIGNRTISELLGSWRQERDHNGNNNPKPGIWISSAIPQGKALAFCGITNEYKRDGSSAASRGEKTLHVMLGFADYTSQDPIEWRPFFARGSSVPLKTLATNTWLDSVLPSLDERGAATLIRRVTGLEQGYTIRNATPANEQQAARARDSAIIEKVDEDDGTMSWRLNKTNVNVWLASNLPQWWAGGAKLGCKPQFFLMAFGA